MPPPDDVDEVYDDHTMVMMTVAMMTMVNMNINMNVDDDGEKLMIFFADHHCLSFFVLPDPGLLCCQTDDISLKMYQQLQQCHQQDHQQ